MENGWMERLAEEIRKRNAKKVLLQLPEGLKFLSTRIIDFLEERGIEASSWMEPTYGACDIIPEVADKLGVDLLVHVGHVKFYRPIPDSNVLYFPLEIKLNPEDFKEQLAGLPKGKYMLITSIQHLSSLDRFVEFIEGMGYQARKGGYVLGCLPIIPKEGENVLFIGSGEFHPSSIPTIASSMPDIYLLDVERKELRKMDAEKWIRRKMARIAKASMAEKFGIVISTKHGQYELIGRAEDIRKRLEKHGKKAYILVMNHISDNKLEGLDVDCIINTACPRIVDDPHGITMINASELDELERVWSALG